MIFGKINGQKAHFETGNSSFLTEWVILWPCGISLTGKYMFGPPVSDKFQNALGDGSRLILTTGRDPVLERAICHLLANGHTAGARLFERRPVCHYAARLAWPRTNGLCPVVEKRVVTRFEMGTECFPECVGPPARPCPPARSRMGCFHWKNIHGAGFSAARG
jgi:hypothetical protein